MPISFLQRLQELAGPAVNKIVGAGGPDAASAERLLRQVLAGLPELLGAAVADAGSGQVLASYTTAREFSLSKAMVFHAEALRQQHRALAALEPGSGQQVQEMVVTLASQLHLLRVLPGGQQLVCVAVDARDTSLGIAREVLRACEDEQLGAAQ